MWQRSKSELKPEDYSQAYQSIAGAFDEPAMTLHYKAEGRQSYAVLLFAPSSRPFDLYDPARKGLEGIMNQYNTALNQLGVTAIEAVGQPFDANRHNAVMHIEDDAYGEGVVVEEFEKGFCIGDRVLRYSVVKVAN